MMVAGAVQGVSGGESAIGAAPGVMPGLTRHPPAILAGKVSSVGPGSWVGATAILANLGIE